MDIETMKAMRDKLADEMREAPLNPVFTDHKGRKSLGNHSSAWARKSREWSDLCAKIEAQEN